MTSKETNTKKPLTSSNSNRDTTRNWQNSNEITNNETTTQDRQRSEILDDITWTQIWLDDQYYTKSNALRQLREDLHHSTMQNYTRQDPLQLPMAYKTSPPTKSTVHKNSPTSAWRHSHTPPTNTQHHKQNPDSRNWHDSNNNKESPKSNEDSELEDLF